MEKQTNNLTAMSYGLFILSEFKNSNNNLFQKSEIQYFDTLEAAIDNMLFKHWKFFANYVSETNHISETYYKRLLKLKSIETISEFKKLRLPKYLASTDPKQRFPENYYTYISKTATRIGISNNVDNHGLFLRIFGPDQTEIDYFESLPKSYPSEN